MVDFELEPRGPYSLAAAQDFAGGFPAGIGGDLLELSEAWRPYRMWAVVLLRVGWNRGSGPSSHRVRKSAFLRSSAAAR